MELIINISEEEYNDCKNRFNMIYQEGYLNYNLNTALIMYIANGTPLPKGHGDLIDRNECLKMKMTDLYDKDGVTMYAVPTGNILRMKPIVEADKENK